MKGLTQVFRCAQQNVGTNAGSGTSRGQAPCSGDTFTVKAQNGAGARGRSYGHP